MRRTTFMRKHQGNSYTGKALTIGIKQNNGRQRHWFRRFRRKTIAVSRSKEMVDLTLFLFAAYHVNGSLELPSLFT